MSDVGEFSRGLGLGQGPAPGVPRLATLLGGGEEANAIRGIALGCALSAVLWAGLGALARAVLG